MSDRKTKEIELGECPFRKDKITASMEWWYGYYGGTTLLIRSPKCGNGCPVEDFTTLYHSSNTREWDDVDKMAGWLRQDWAEAVKKWRRREKCPYCGAMPKFSVNGDGYLDLGCANEGHEPLTAKGCGGFIVKLVEDWDGIALPIRHRLEREAKNNRLLAVLNA